MNNKTCAAAVHAVDDTAVIELTGEVDGSAAAVLNAAYQQAIADGAAQTVVLDFARVDYINSTGISGRLRLPCSIAFMVASATAVFSRSSRGPVSPRPATASATRASATRSLPGSLATANDASCRPAGWATEVIRHLPRTRRAAIAAGRPA